MSSSRTNKDSDPAGEIRLRQTAQLTVADQTRTFEIAVTLPASASDEEIDRAARQAEIGMRALSEQLDRHVAAVRETAGGQMIDAAHSHAPLLSEPHTNGATAPEATTPEPPPAPVASAAEELSPAAAAPVPPATPAAATKPATKRASAANAATAEPSMPGAMTLQEFLAEAGEMGYDVITAAKALGMTSLKDVDLTGALAQLRALHAAPVPTAPAPAPAAPVPAPAFAEEIGPYDAVNDGDDLAEMDEPDFGALSDEHDDAAFAGEPEPAPEAAPANKAQTAEARRRAAAERRLRQMRAIGGGAVAATPELRTALGNCFINPLGKELAADVVSAIWHPAPGERLNAARTRALVEWGKEDDDLEDTAMRVVILARQPQPEEV